MQDIIIPADKLEQERLKTNFKGEELTRLEYLYSQLAQIYSIIFYPDPDDHRAINPFWDYENHRPNNKRIEKYEYAFTSRNLYVELRKEFERKGYVVEREEGSKVFRGDETPNLEYHAGYSYIFVPRK